MLLRLCFFLLVIGFTGCGKLHEERIRGSINDVTTGATISDASIGLYDFHDHSTSNLKLLESTTSGSDGRFEIMHNLKNGKSYALLIQKNGYQDIFYSFEGDQLLGFLDFRMSI